MATRKTTVVLEAQAKGFEKTRRAAKQTFDTLDTKKLEKGFAALEKSIDGLGRQMRVLGDMTKTVKDLTAAIEKMTGAKKKDNEEDDRGGRKKRANRRGFAMGVMQGAGIGEYFPEQGLRANVAGRLIGRGAGAAPQAFTGSSGFVNALRAQPLVGAAVGAILGPAVQMAQQGVAIQRTRQQAAQGMTPGALLAGDSFGDGPIGFRDRGQSIIDNLRSQGVSFGMGEQAATAFSQQLLSTSGLGRERLAGAGGEALLQRAMAAQASLGISAQASGAFMRPGAAAGGSEGLVDTIEKGFKLGLRGSDLTNYMQQMAQGIMQFEQTGLPINPRSLAEIGNELQAQGLSGMRGVNVARGLLGAGQQMGRTGAQDPAQFLMLRDVYGYGGGGMDDYVNAMRKAATGGAQAKGVNRLIQTITGGNRDATAAMSLLQYFNQLGVQASILDIDNLFSDDPTAREEATQRFQTQFDEKTMRTDASRKMKTATQEAARLENRRADIGVSMIPAIQNFEEVSINLAQGAAVFSKEMGSVAKVINDITGEIAPMMKDGKKLIDELLVVAAHITGG